MRRLLPGSLVPVVSWYSFQKAVSPAGPGLSEFYLGAFKIAAEAGKPVIPGRTARYARHDAQRPMVPASNRNQLGNR